MTEQVHTPTQLDALREVANVGSGHAASALARLMGDRPVRIDVPQVLQTGVEAIDDVLGPAGQPMVTVVLGLSGELSGHLLFAMTEKDARLLATVMLREPSMGAFTTVQKSALSEASNILGSACLSAIGTFSGLKLLPTTPELLYEVPRTVVERSVAISHTNGSSRTVTAVAVHLFSDGHPALRGTLLFVPDRHSVGVLLRRLGV